jgi:hypothetical protein
MATASKVLADYKKFVEEIRTHSISKVSNAVIVISDTTNSKYASDGSDNGIRLIGAATTKRIDSGKSIITGYASANETKELIYLEFGTRRIPSDNLKILTGFESGIDTISISAPYKSNRRFNFKDRIIGRYYFLNTIDQEGLKFLKNFFK